MSQRLLIHLYSLFATCDHPEFLDATREHRDRGEAVTHTEDIEPRNVSHAGRTLGTEFEHKNTGFTVPDIDDVYLRSELQPEVGVQVKIERTVKLDRQLRASELELFSEWLISR
jgi:hypothetical protein